MRHPSDPLTFRDGFGFGCGFWAAGFFFFAVFLPMVILFTAFALAIFGGFISALAG